MAFQNLPAEILLELLSHLSWGSALDFSLAYYPTLLRHGIVPPVPRAQLQRLIIIRRTNPALPQFGFLPLHLQDLMLDFLDIATLIRLALALY
jgi:hypothetical protein